MGRATKMNSITSPLVLAQVNPSNKRLKKEFLDYLRSIQRAEGTINGYSNDLDIFFVWVFQNAQNKPFKDITKRDMISFQNWLIYDNNNGPSRIRRIKACLSSLSNFIENILDDEEEYKNFRSIVKKVESPVNRPVRDKTVWSDEELENLLSALIEKKQYHKACYLALGMYSGRRKSELARFKVSDFTEDKLVCERALYKSAPIKTKGRGEGKYIPCYTLAKKFTPYLNMWMDERNKSGIESEWLFPDPDNLNDHINISTINSWANTFSKITGKYFYVHSLRHYFTTSLIRAGIPDSVVTQIIGWESSDMCKIYTDIEADEQIGMYFKNGDISVENKTSFAEI